MTTTSERRSTPLTPPPPPRRGPRALLAALAVAATALVSTLAIAPQAPVPGDAPATVFSATRAMAHVQHLGQAPRTIGSAAHAGTQTYLADSLASSDWQVEVQRTVGFTDWGTSGTQRLAEVANVVATLPGSAPTGTVVLAAHYDTVSGSPGAADDGVGVAAVLEAARALGEGPGRTRNDVVVLMSDGEETGLLGAEAFVREHAATLGPTVVLNHEARGVGGTPMTFRITSPNGELLHALSSVAGVFVDSSTEATFETLPHDSDFRHFSDAWWHGLDTALVAGAAFYHSPLDDASRLSPASLQQMGQTTLALARTLTDVDLATLQEGGEERVTTLPWGLLRYPATLDVPLAAGTLALALTLVVVARRRRTLTLPRTAVAVAIAAACLVAAGGAGLAVWLTALAIDPAQASAVLGEPYQPMPYHAAMLLASAGVVAAMVGPARRLLGGTALPLGSLVLLAAGGLVLALALPGMSMGIVLPTVCIAMSVGLAAVLPRRWSTASDGILLLGVMAATVLIAPGIWAGFDVGLGLGGPVSAAFLALLLLLALPLVDALRPAPTSPRRGSRRGSWRAVAVPGMALTLATAVGALGLVLNREDMTPPRQESVSYLLAADTGEGHWISSTPRRSAWSHALLPAGPEALDQAPWTNGADLVHGPAPAAPGLTGPDLEVLDDRTRDGLRELTLRLSSTRGAPTVGLWVDARTATVREARVAGRDLPVRGAEGSWDFGFQFTGSTPDGVVVRLVLEPHSTGITLRVADRSDDLHGAPGLALPAGRVLVTPFVFVTRDQTL